MTLCDQCEKRRETDRQAERSDPSIKAAGGFCVPTKNFYFEPHCTTYRCPRFRDWFDRGFFRNPIWYWKTWQEMHRNDGGMVHGYPGRISLPPLRAKRGGIKFS